MGNVAITSHNGISYRIETDRHYLLVQRLQEPVEPEGSPPPGWHKVWTAKPAASVWVSTSRLRDAITQAKHIRADTVEIQWGNDYTTLRCTGKHGIHFVDPIGPMAEGCCAGEAIKGYWTTNSLRDGRKKIEEINKKIGEVNKIRKIRLMYLSTAGSADFALKIEGRDSTASIVIAGATYPPPDIATPSSLFMSARDQEIIFNSPREAWLDDSVLRAIHEIDGKEANDIVEEVREQGGADCSFRLTPRWKRRLKPLAEVMVEQIVKGHYRLGGENPLQFKGRIPKDEGWVWRQSWSLPYIAAFLEACGVWSPPTFYPPPRKTLEGWGIRHEGRGRWKVVHIKRDAWAAILPARRDAERLLGVLAYFDPDNLPLERLGSFCHALQQYGWWHHMTIRAYKELLEDRRGKEKE